MAIDDEVSCNTNIEKHFSRLIDNVESCFSRMDKEKYRWDFMESNLSHIYNNLPVILKSKGTEKSFRNLIRCYGVDENLIKLNLYGNNTTHLIRNNFDSSIIRKRYANFSTENKVEATVVQQTASNDTVNTRSYISSSNEMTFIGNTYQAEVIFPKKSGGCIGENLLRLDT